MKRSYPKKLIRLGLLPALLVCLLSCTGAPREHKAQFYVFGTVVDVTVWSADEENTGEAFSDISKAFRDMHRDWHAWEPGKLTEINEAFSRSQAVEAPPDVIEMTERAQHIEELSGGRFNPAIGGLIRLWGFHTSDYPILGPPPQEAEITALLKQRPSSLDIEIEENIMRSANPAVQLDFGGIAKGYAIDIACQLLRDRGIDNAIVNAGGDLKTIGNHGDRPWRIAIRSPGGGVVGSLEAGTDEAIFTSGNYERFRLDDNERYPHILDPRSGWPVQDLASATVITREGILADAAATAVIVAGLDDWEAVAEALQLDQVLIVDEYGLVYMTPKMAERIELLEGIEAQITQN
jgi:thiamine biosynthesis lipoprotein